jgi:hypothetical protein
MTRPHHPNDDNGNAHTCLLIVLGGTHGSGFSVQTHDGRAVDHIPELLRSVADKIEKERLA